VLDFRTYTEERARDFIGRDWLFQSIDDWLQSDNGSRFFSIIGEPGSGKTAIAARLVGYSTGTFETGETWKCIGPGFLSAAHFCSLRDAGWTDPLQFVRSIAHQLGQRYPAFWAALINTPGENPVNITSSVDVASNRGTVVGVSIENLIITGTPKPSSVFVRVIRTPLEALFKQDPKARITVLVDALDEAEDAASEGDSIASLILKTAALPSGLRFIVTTRPVATIEPALQRVGSPADKVSLSVGDGGTRSRVDVTEYVANALRDRVDAEATAALGTIAAKAGTNFLYARFALRVFGNASATEIDAVLARLPPGLDALYFEYLERLPDNKQRSEWRNLYRPILGTLKVARRQLTLRELSAFTKLEETSVLDAVAILSQLLNVETVDGNQPSYRLYHQSFADFLEGGSAEQYQCKASLFHAAIARTYDGQPLDAYAWRWLSYHLMKAGREDDLHRLLLDFTYLQGKLDATEANALLADFDFLRSAADLRLIKEAVQLSSHVIAHDPRQFASQLVGRLLLYEIPLARHFTQSVVAAAPRPWLRPVKPALQPPGTGLLSTLAGHIETVEVVAVTPDGRRAVSASADRTLKVWELETGRELHTLAGHTHLVRAVAVTPDGRRAVSASEDQTLKVWELETGHELHTLAGHTGEITAVAVTPDGRRAVSASNDETLKVWELETGHELHILAGHTNAVRAVAVTPDGRRAVSASWDTLKVWELGSGRELQTLAGHTNLVRAVAVTPDGRRAVSASDDRTLKVWELETGRELHTLAGHTDLVRAVAVTPDGRRVVSASDDRTLKVWELETGRELHTLAGHTDGVLAVAVTPDGRRAVSASRDQTLKVWELETGRELHTLAGHTDGVLAVAVTPDGRRAVSASWDDTLKVWELETGSELHILAGHTDVVNAVVVTPDGRRAVSASDDQTLKVWELETGRELHILSGHTREVNAVAVTPDGRRAVSASNERTLKVWELETGRELHILAGHRFGVNGSGVNAVVVTPDGRRAVSASYDRTLKMWELETGRELRTLAGHTGPVSAVAVTPEGRRLVSASWDHTLKVWELETGRELHTLAGHTNWVWAVAVTPDGRRAVSASDDWTLKVWELETGRELHTLAGHTNKVRAVAVTPDGRRAVSASWDHTLKVWELETGRDLHTFVGHTGEVRAVAVTPDGRRAVSASDDQTLKVWELETGASIATFSCDASVGCCDFASKTTIVAGDASGQIHILALEM